MANTIIKLDCIDQNLIVAESPVISSGGANSTSVEIKFSSEWDGLGKSATFRNTKYETVYEIVLTNDSCVVPAEVLEEGRLEVGVRGVDSNYNLVKTSSLVKFKIVKGAPMGDGTAVEPTSTVYEQLLTAYAKAEKDVAVERARIDGIIALPEGSATGDAELQDIRIDADGIRHTNAGDAVRSYQRSKINHITGNLNEYVEPIQGLATGATNAPTEKTGFVIVEHVKTAKANAPWILQRWYTYNDNKMFFRFRVGQTWGKWQDVGEKSFENYITDDVNNYREKDICAIVGIGTQNAPVTDDSGFLDVQRYSTGTNVWVLQKWRGITKNKTFARTFHSDIWEDWKEDKHVSSSEPLNGKTVVFIGDSIFGNERGATGIVNLFADYTGATCYNFAFGGTRAKARQDDNGWNYFDGENLAIAIANGDFSAQENVMETMEGMPFYFPNVIETMKTFDFSKVDYIVCNYGTNDWTAGNNVETYRDAVENVIETITTTYPNIVFVKCTPTERFIVSGNDVVSGGSYANKTSGITLKQIVNEDYEVQKITNVPVIDLFNIGINEHNKDAFFDNPDYTHHNENGRKRIAFYLSNKII